MALSVALSAGEPTRGRGYEKLPLIFEPNQGQTTAQVRYLARGGGYTLFLTDREAVLSLRGAAPVTMSLIGGARPKEFQQLEPTGGISNYFIGNDPAKWRTNVPHYQRVQYRGVYPGVDLVYYGNGGRLEYDLVVAPGADSSQIEIAYQGVESLRLDGKGDLLLKTAAGELLQQRPKVYQQEGGRRIEVAARYRLDGRKNVSFELARYDHAKQLIIDPVLVYSSYLGGTGNDVGYGIAVDSSGNAYLTGYTVSTDFPTTGAIQSTNHGSNDVFVTKINAAGSAKVYSTFLGGTGYDIGNAIAVDANGNAYVAGMTQSTDFPAASPLQATNGGGADAFVVKLNAAGSSMTYSTYLGGTGGEQANGIAVDSSGNAYVTGFTSSTDFPIFNQFQSTNGGAVDAFVTKINPSGSAKVYSSYLGGSANDVGNGIAVDATGNAYIVGYTFSNNFPTFNPLQASNGGSSVAFVTKVNPPGSAKVYSTYLGGTASDQGNAIAVDSNGNAYVTGYTTSSDFPVTSSVVQTSYGGSTDAFVTKISANGSTKAYSTYLGGSGGDVGTAIALDAAGNAYVAGSTVSTNFPVASPVQATNGGGSDAFVTALNATGTTKIYSTYFGGSNGESAQGIAVDSSGNAYVTGVTLSTNFPTAVPFQASNANAATTDAFVFSISAGSGMGVNPGSGSGMTQTFTFSFTDPNGYSDLAVLDILINDFLDGQQACYVAVVPATATTGYLYMVDDAGTGGYVSGTPMFMPTGNSLHNSQCTVNGAGSSISASGNTFTVTLAITFSPTFAGNKIFYLAARSNTQNSGWQALGTWNVPGTPPTGPAVGGVSPGRSTSIGQTYSFTFTDTNGFADLTVLDILTNSFLDGMTACYVAYVPAGPTNGYIYMVDNAGDGGYVSGSPMLLSSGGTLQNSQCSINTAASSASASGNTLTVNLSIAFSQSFAGNQVFYLAARNNTTGNSGWQAVGSVTVP